MLLTQAIIPKAADWCGRTKIKIEQNGIALTFIDALLKSRDFNEINPGIGIINKS